MSTQVFKMSSPLNRLLRMFAAPLGLGRATLASRAWNLESNLTHEKLEPSALDEATEMFMASIAKEEGFGRGEYDGEGAVRKLLTKNHTYVIRDKSTLETVGFFSGGDLPFTRCEKPIYHSSNSVLKPGVRNRGIGLYCYFVMHKQLRKDGGYVGSITRMTAASPVLVGAFKNSRALGVMPNCLYLTEVGWMDDILFYESINNDMDRNVPIIQESLQIPPLKYTDSMMSLINKEHLDKIDFPKLDLKGKTLSVEVPSAEDLCEVEEMIREAAQDGAGFALDEFNSDGFLNRQMLHKANMLVLKDDEGSVKAGLVFGPTKLSRDPRTTQVGGYMVVRKADRGEGLGTALLNYCLDHKGLLGYTGVLTDVFVNNHVMLNMLTRKGFVTTATMLNSGVVKGNGRTDVSVMLKQTEPPKKPKT